MMKSVYLHAYIAIMAIRRFTILSLWSVQSLADGRHTALAFICYEVIPKGGFLVDVVCEESRPPPKA